MQWNISKLLLKLPATPIGVREEVGVMMMPEPWKYQRAVGLGLGLTVARMMHCSPSEDC